MGRTSAWTEASPLGAALGIGPNIHLRMHIKPHVRSPVATRCLSNDHSHCDSARRPMSVFVWVMMGIAIWHGCVLIPDRFYGGLIGAFLAAVFGAVGSGYLLPVPGIP